MKRLLFALAILSVLIAACGPVASARLSSGQKKWEQANIPHYRFKLRVACFCGFTEKMPLSIEIDHGRLVSMTYNDGSAVSPQEAQTFAPYQTIDDLFGFTADAIRRADQIDIQYDPTYGFPTQVQIDFIKNAADDELALFVTDFEPLP